MLEGSDTLIFNENQSKDDVDDEGDDDDGDDDDNSEHGIVYNHSI